MGIEEKALFDQNTFHESPKEWHISTTKLLQDSFIVDIVQWLSLGIFAYAVLGGRGGDNIAPNDPVPLGGEPGDAHGHQE